jgi:hypothetical protein
MRKPDLVRLVLAAIRIVNGAVALFAPKTMLRRLDVDPETNGAAIYVLRMFGIRTLLLGVELFTATGERRERAVRDAVVIHGTDAAGAFVTLARKELPRRAGVLVTLISSVNAGLAWIARSHQEAGELAGTAAE